MAKYPYAVKVNGVIIPPDTEITIDETGGKDNADSADEEGVKKRKRKA